jgi:hypothetical protein
MAAGAWLERFGGGLLVIHAEQQAAGLPKIVALLGSSVKRFGK